MTSSMRSVIKIILSQIKDRRMSDSDNEAAAANQMEEEEREREERNQIWACFMQYDVDQQGVMSTSDLKSALESLGERVSDTQVFRMIADADPNNLGQI